MSSPEFAELRGIQGGAVAAKAATLLNPRKRRLLFFLQAMSLRPGGLNQFSEDFIALFPKRLSSLDPNELPDFVTELCINPCLKFNAEGDKDWTRRHEDESARRLCDATDSTRGRFAEQSCYGWFDDFIGGLFEFQKRFEEAARKQFVMTSIGREVFETLDFCIETGKPVAIVGDERIGKTTAIEAWCNLHLGEVRYVSLSGLTNRTTVLRSIARAVGLASSYTRKAMEMQERVEDFFQRSRLVLVIDEAHFLFSQSVRLYSRPELVDWIDTALYNHGVPFALCATPQFPQRLNEFEKQTGWNAGQFKGRVKRWRMLEAPTTDDLMSVARKLLPEADAATIKLVVGYALKSKRHMPAIVDTIDEARLLARNARRNKVIYEDVERALNEFVQPSDDAKERAFSPPGRARATPFKAGRKSAETPLQRSGKAADRMSGGEDLPAEKFDGRNGLSRSAPAVPA